MRIDLCIVGLYIQYGSAQAHASLSHIESRRIKWNLRQIGIVSSKVSCLEKPVGKFSVIAKFDFWNTFPRNCN